MLFIHSFHNINALVCSTKNITDTFLTSNYRMYFRFGNFHSKEIKQLKVVLQMLSRYKVKTEREVDFALYLMYFSLQINLDFFYFNTICTTICGQSPFLFCSSRIFSLCINPIKKIIFILYLYSTCLKCNFLWSESNLLILSFILVFIEKTDMSLCPVFSFIMLHCLQFNRSYLHNSHKASLDIGKLRWMKLLTSTIMWILVVH